MKLAYFFERAIDSFQLESEALVKACIEQEKELRFLQNLMNEQRNRTDVITAQEDMVLQSLNALEIDAHNFGEESHLVTNMCSSVMDEIDAMSRVKLISIPFNVAVDWSHVGGSQKAGRYPTINGLRLAYRINEKAGLGREEINAAWVQAAQLIAFACGLNPSFTSSDTRVIPLSHPCAKILTTNSSGGQNVYNLGWDTLNFVDHSDHIPHDSLICFLSVLNQLTSHVLAMADWNGYALGMRRPPFQMTQRSIDTVDVIKLADSDMAAWSSVVFCIAANLGWLSKLPMGGTETL